MSLFTNEMDGSGVKNQVNSMYNISGSTLSWLSYSYTLLRRIRDKSKLLVQFTMEPSLFKSWFLLSAICSTDVYIDHTNRL